MKKNFTPQEWLKIVGKERLQALQDSLAKVCGVGLIFLDLQGRPLTVGSNSPMLCHKMLENPEIRERCEKEHQRILVLQDLNRGKIMSCYTGLKYIICPVFFNGQRVAFLRAAGIAYNDGALPKAILDKYRTAIMTPEKLETICELLSDIMELLNFDLTQMQAVIEEKADIDPKAKLFANKLSHREEEVASLICEGMSNKAIAKRLFISEKTVKTHVSNILVKLDLRDRMQLVVNYCRDVIE